MPLTVLLATGDRDHRDALDEAMSTLGLRVRRVETGEDALQENAIAPAGLSCTRRVISASSTA